MHGLELLLHLPRNWRPLRRNKRGTVDGGGPDGIEGCAQELKRVRGVWRFAIGFR